MNCDELINSLSSYVDDEVTPDERVAIDAHLAVCPVCRAELSALQTVLRGVWSAPRPTAPVGLSFAITDALFVEATAAKRQKQISLRDLVGGWLQPRLVPYSAGALASIVLFIAMFAALRSSLTGFHYWARTDRMVAARYEDDEGYDLNLPITPEHYAARRSAYSPESPSLNPDGALAALTSIPAENDGDDDMVVVADVFSNGIASLAGVVQPPRDRRMLEQLQDALRKDPAFVPAAYDRRPQTMRVVFVVQKVAVSERSQ
jgi:hypothetical protein